MVVVSCETVWRWKMRICLCSDIHGQTSKVNIPECDLLLIAGDNAPWSYSDTIYTQSNWYNDIFEKWAKNQPTNEWYATFGNHCFAGQRVFGLFSGYLKQHFLVDRQVIYQNKIIYGTPWSIDFGRWAFNLPECRLEERWKNIPDNVNILITHAPPYEILDDVDRYEYGMYNHETIYIGSPTLRNRIKELNNLQLHVFGHAHQLGGNTKKIENTIFCNAAICNEEYKIVKSRILEIEID